jgi:asparagine synthase (glutamine-hydrolysing)
MSAIAGLHRTDGPLLAGHEVERMISALGHRAPDGTASWSRESVGLAYGGLWTTSEAVHETQPLTRGPCVIVADARLDNREELATALDTSGVLGDAELILRAYLRWGEACPPKLLGDFAFAIWDGANRRLFCARDHIGVKPFYYHQAPGTFLFASEIKALLTNPTVPYSLNRVRVADHLVGLFDDQKATFYRDIYRLPAGHALTVSRERTRIWSYWTLDAVRELRLGSDEAYAEAVRECFTAAVKSRLRSRRPVGSLLSGGLDTASIVATARSLRGTDDGDLDTFTAVFPGLPAADLRKIDERIYVDALVAQGRLRAHYIRGDVLSPLGDLDRVLWHLDEAHAAPNLYLHWALYGAARDRGVGVLLDGIDGDTTVSHGLERLAGLVRQGKVLTLGYELRQLGRRYRVPVSRLMWQFAIQPLVPFSLRQAVRQLRRREPSWLSHSVISPDFARSTGVADRVAAFQRSQDEPVRSPLEAHRRAMQSGLIPYALELADKAAVRFGLEPRYPFFDRRLMELCLSVPAEQKLQGGWSRSVMRRAMNGLMPDEVRWRASKANLSPNFTRRLLAGDRRLLSQVVHDQTEVIEEFVDIAALRRTHDRYVAQPGSDADALTMYSAVVLACWLQQAKLTV